MVLGLRVGSTSFVDVGLDSFRDRARLDSVLRRRLKVDKRSQINLYCAPAGDRTWAAQVRADFEKLMYGDPAAQARCLTNEAKLWSEEYMPSRLDGQADRLQFLIQVDAPPAQHVTIDIATTSFGTFPLGQRAEESDIATAISTVRRIGTVAGALVFGAWYFFAWALFLQFLVVALWILSGVSFVGAFVPATSWGATFAPTCQWLTSSKLAQAGLAFAFVALSVGMVDPNHPLGPAAAVVFVMLIAKAVEDVFAKLLE